MDFPSMNFSSIHVPNVVFSILTSAFPFLANESSRDLLYGGDRPGFYPRLARVLASTLVPAAEAGAFGKPRVIMDRAGDEPYLSRFYIKGAPRMLDGSSPFNDQGNPKREAIWPEHGGGIYLHRFHKDDDDEELHNHPWEWAVSLVLVGGYDEERRIYLRDTFDGAGVGERTVDYRELRPGDINVLTMESFHRVELAGDSHQTPWSLFIAGPRSQGWGFWNKDTGEYTDWRRFLEQK